MPSKLLGAAREYSARPTGSTLANPISLSRWKATAQASETGWPVERTTADAIASTAGASVLIETPIAILVISLGSGRCRLHQRQNSTAAAIRIVLKNASTVSIHVIGMVRPKKTIWKFRSPHIR